MPCSAIGNQIVKHPITVPWAGIYLMRRLWEQLHFAWMDDIHAVISIA